MGNPIYESTSHIKLVQNGYQTYGSTTDSQFINFREKHAVIIGAGLIYNPSGLRPDRRGGERFVDRENSVHRTFWKIWKSKFRS